MITVRFLSGSGLLAGFTVRGHAGWAQSGRDIVCAAVSSAALMTANTLTEVLKAPCKVSGDDGEMGVLPDDPDEPFTQQLLRGFSLHMREMSREYPDHLKVIYGGKHNA